MFGSFENDIKEFKRNFETTEYRNNKIYSISDINECFTVEEGDSERILFYYVNDEFVYSRTIKEDSDYEYFNITEENKKYINHLNLLLENDVYIFSKDSKIFIHDPRIQDEDCCCNELRMNQNYMVRR